MTRKSILAALESDVLRASRALLGTHLVRGARRARIVEVEAYRAEGDPGSHAFRGRTKRNDVMFGRAGLAYVYFNYGVHWMLNVTAHPHGQAAAILVRAAEPLDGLDEMFASRPSARKPKDLLSGPGKLAAAFDITGEDYGVDLFDPKSELRIEPGTRVRHVQVGLRVGLAPGKGEELPWRFIDADAKQWISQPLKVL
jgi:DNA-3-methyladenine glycosylase